MDNGIKYGNVGSKNGRRGGAYMGSLETANAQGQEAWAGNRELKSWRRLFEEEDGMGTVEIILIIVVLVGLVLIFKEQITSIVESIFSKITKQTNKF